MSITLEDARKVLEAAYPMQGVTVEHGGVGTSYKICTSSGEVIGSSFDLKLACRQAVEPALKAEAERRIAADKARTQDFIMFMSFLRERFADEYEAFKARAEAETGGEVGAEPDSKQLVHLLP